MQLSVLLYSRPQCHLCDAARQVVLPLREEFGFEFQEVDVDSDSALQERYGADIPVVLLNGREVARHRVDRAAFAGELAREAGRARDSAR